jgi:PKD repeat protein
VTFTYNITPDTNVALRSATIDFGDGQSQNLGTARSGSIPHTYRRSGTYIAELEVVDVNGETGVATAAVVVTPAPPLLPQITVQPNPARVNAVTTVNVTLSNSSLLPLVTGVDYDFGDNSAPIVNGTTSQTHVYTRPGDFPLRVTVRLNDGRSETRTQNVVVLPAQ